ncbi:MAG: histidine phosphatase family protein [Nodosilinea sp.]
MQTFGSYFTTNLSWLSGLPILTLALTLNGCAVTLNPAPQAQSSPIVQAEASPFVQPETTSPNTGPASDAELWAGLQAGTGYVVLLRHTQTTPGTGDPPGFRLNDCATQRNLSAAGKVQASRIGQTFRHYDIDISQVLSSQYCRCLETSKLMNIGAVQPTQMLNSIFTDRSNSTQQIQQVNQHILKHRENAGVVVMVTHFANVLAVSGVSLQPGDAVVLQANEQGEIDIIGQIQGL